MKSDVISLSDYAFLGQIGTVIFVAVFVAAIFWIFRRGSKAVYAARSQMPLDDVNPVEYLPPEMGGR